MVAQMDMDKIILDSFKKSLDLVGQNVKINDTDNKFLFNTRAIIKPSKVFNEDNGFYSSVADIYKISTIDNLQLNQNIIYKNKQYKIQSVIDTKPFFTAICKYITMVMVYKIQLEKTSSEINEGFTYQIVATCLENDKHVDNPEIIYKSSDTSIATVSTTGLITGIKQGSCQIECNFHDIVATFNVKINKKLSATPIDIKTLNRPLKGKNSTNVKIGDLETFVVIDKEKKEEIVGRKFNFYMGEEGIFEVIEEKEDRITLKAIGKDYDFIRLTVKDQTDETCTAYVDLYVVRKYY